MIVYENTRMHNVHFIYLYKFLNLIILFKQKNYLSFKMLKFKLIFIIFIYINLSKLLEENIILNQIL